jgi:hypothetical protein
MTKSYYISLKMKKLILLFILLYNSSFAQENNSLCGSTDADLTKEDLETLRNLPQIIQAQKARKPSNDDFYFCRVVVDIDYETVKRYNGDTVRIKDDVAIMIQKTSQIYEREIKTKLVLTYVNIWKTQATDPYTNTSDINAMLTILRNAYTSNAVLSKIPSDVVMYLPSKNFLGAGGLASGKYNVSPWNGISTIAHEIGHNFGSPHTQSCNWAGGPLDFCYSAESTCYTGVLEQTNGTLMSYCNRRFNTFHPTCIALMSQNTTTRYQRIKAITETIKLPDNYTFNANTYLSWTNIFFAENYIIELASDSDFKNIVARDTTQQSYGYMPYLKRNQSYFLRILPTNRLGMGQWSNTMKIITPANLLEVPRLVTPANNSIDIDSQPINFTFSTISGATGYQLQYILYNTGSTSFAFDMPTTRTLSTNSFSLTIAAGSTAEAVTWRVRATNGSDFGAWSESFTAWLKPASINLNLSAPQLPINGYPLSFPITYFGNIGNNLQVSLKVSENQNFNTPIVNKTWALSEFPNINYTYLLQNLKPNTTYYLRFEEHNLAEQNIIGIPKGLVRMMERSFKTGTDMLPAAFNYFTNSNIENLGRNIRKVVFNENYAFALTTSGVVRMKVDGSESKLFNRATSKNIVSNAILDIKTDAKGDLWILTTVSKRLKISGNFPLTVYLYGKVNPETFVMINGTEFNLSTNASVNSFDVNSGLLTNNISDFHKIVRDSTQRVYFNSVGMNNLQFGKDDIWFFTNNIARQHFEIKNVDLNTLKETTFSRDNNNLLNASINQIYLDSKGQLWVWQSGNIPALKWTKETGFVPVKYNLGLTPGVIGDYNGVLYLVVSMSNTIRDIYSYDGEVLKKNESVLALNSFALDKTGKIWFWASDKILRLNPCFGVKTPTLRSSKNTIIRGETVQLTAEGCNGVEWSWNTDNQATQFLRVLDRNTLTVNPANITTYKAKCIENECVGEFSNAIEANVLSLAIRSADKNKYCSGETLNASALIAGRFATNNEFKAIFNDGKRQFTANVNTTNGAMFQIPKVTQNGKYWLKLQSTNPVVTSSDSLEINLFIAPTATLTGVSTMNLFDSTKINIAFTGTPPFKFIYNNQTLTHNSLNFTQNFIPKEPIVYNFSILGLSDANCPLGEIISKDLAITASINPIYRNYWVQNYPVPFENELNIDVYNKPGKKVLIDLYDALGRLIFQKEYPIESYLDKHKIDLKNVSSGVYFLRINTGLRQEVRKIVK